MSKNIYKGIAAIAAFAVAVLYNNCSPVHDSGSSDYSSALFSASGKCSKILLDAFSAQDGLHSALTNKCSSCHVPNGSGNGQFAAADVNVAFSSFMQKGLDKVYEFGANPNHKPPYSGAEAQALLDPAKDAFEDAEAQYSQCLADSGGSDDDGPGGPGLPTPTISTIAKAIPANATTPQVIEFDLGTELQGKSVANVRIQITVQSFTAGTGATGYDISNPTLIVGATNGAVLVKNIGIKLNNTLVGAPSGSTFQNVNRYVAANTTRSLYQSGAMRVLFNIAQANTISVAFQDIGVDSAVNFTPASYTNLTAAANQAGTIRVFALRCAGCHSGATPDAGISLTAADYTINALTRTFIPYKPQESLLWLSVNSDAMPPGAPLPANEKEFIRGWIMDGAPR